MATLNISDQIELNYRVDRAGDTVWLLFNGATLPLEFWDSLVEKLEGMVIRFDQRNAGNTKSSGPFTLNDVAADAARLLDHLEVERVVVLGHAWGGRVAQVFVRDYPHLVRGLIICGTGGQFPSSVSDKILKAVREAVKARDRDAWETALEAAYCAKEFANRNPEIFRSITDTLWAKPTNHTTRWDHRVSPSSSYWGTSRVPTLLIYGKEDKFGTPENARDLNRAIEGSRLVFIEQAGHFVVREVESAVLTELSAFSKQLTNL